MSACKFDMESLIVGQGQSANIRQSCAFLGIKHALVVTDSGLATLGLHSAVLDSLSKFGDRGGFYKCHGDLRSASALWRG